MRVACCRYLSRTVSPHGPIPLPSGLRNARCCCRWRRGVCPKADPHRPDNILLCGYRYAEVIADSKKIIKGAKTRLGADMKTKLEVVRTEAETIKTAEQKVSNWAQRKMHLQTGFKHWSGNVKETFRIKGLWRRWMKKVEGRHGTAVST